MKITTYIKQTLIFFSLLSIMIIGACDDDDGDDPAPVVKDPIASFQFAISETDFSEVTFTNYSQNATSYTWNFGDGGTSTEENPVYTYSNAGTYEVKLTASNSEGKSADFSATITITDPNEALNLLTGGSSKTWRLYREGTCMGIGPDAAGAGSWWSLSNDGSRPCVYKQEWTFNTDGSFSFNDNGVFWGEGGILGADVNETCFEVGSSLANVDGTDVSAWLSGTHNFTYDPTIGELTLTGTGAWIGLIKVTPTGDVNVPQASVTYEATIEEKEGFDLLHITVTGDGFYWFFDYASYHDASLEPAIVEDKPAFGEDLDDITPTEMWNTFASATDFVLLDTAAVYPGTGLAANGGMTFTMGVDDPAGGGTKVGEYYRAGTYQELHFMQQNDIQFDNFTTVSLDVYVPSTNDFSGDLVKGISIIIGEGSQTEQWWNGHIQYDVNADDIVLDTWQTWTFTLDEPTSGPGLGQYTPHSRSDLDFFAISIGGGGHTAEGTFYIRNFKFE